ncbi:hypothetical protein N7490_006174 [Penicillium lividum]|nr:hypothetical protein N7490_006174 [Penicillium lividum]
MGANMMPVPPRNLTDFEKSFMVNNRDGIVCPRWFIRDCMINCAISERLAKAFFTHIRACQDSQRFIQLVIHLLYGQLDQYSCSTPGIVRRFIQGSFFDKLATTWTVKQDTLTGLHATCEEPFDPALFKDNPPDEMLSIFQSIPQELLA